MSVDDKRHSLRKACSLGDDHPWIGQQYLTAILYPVSIILNLSFITIRSQLRETETKW